MRFEISFTVIEVEQTEKTDGERYLAVMFRLVSLLFNFE